MLQFALVALILLGIAAMFFLVNDLREMAAYIKALDDASYKRADGDWPHVPSEKPPVFHASGDTHREQ